MRHFDQLTNWVCLLFLQLLLYILINFECECSCCAFSCYLTHLVSFFILLAK